MAGIVSIRTGPDRRRGLAIDVGFYDLGREEEHRGANSLPKPTTSL